MTRHDLKARIEAIERGGLGLRATLWEFHVSNTLPENDSELAANVVAAEAFGLLGRVLLDEGQPGSSGDLMRQVDHGESARYVGIETRLCYSGRDFSDAQRERWDELWRLERKLRPPTEQRGDLRYR